MRRKGQAETNKTRGERKRLWVVMKGMGFRMMREKENNFMGKGQGQGRVKCQREASYLGCLQGITVKVKVKVKMEQSQKQSQTREQYEKKGRSPCSSNLDLDSYTQTPPPLSGEVRSL